MWFLPVFLQFSYFTITVSHQFANFQCHPLWQKRKYTILIFGIWHPTALLRKELFIIFHNRCIFIIATILLRFQKSVCLRFHKKCSARKKTRKTTIWSSGCTIREISFIKYSLQIPLKTFHYFSTHRHETIRKGNTFYFIQSI